MTKLSSFNMNNPIGNTEKAIVDIVNDLKSVFHASIKLKMVDFNDNHLFDILSDSNMAFVGHTLVFLSTLLIDDDEKKLFVKKQRNIFEKYLNLIEES